MKPKPSRVVRIRASGLPDDPRKIPPDALERMIEAGLFLLTGTDAPGDAWARYFHRRDTIEIKVNCLGGRQMCTRPALAAAAASSLASLGIAPHQVIVWDRIGRELRRCGFPLNNRRNGSFRGSATEKGGWAMSGT